jgi:uncharacterized protein (DUF433 family)
MSWTGLPQINSILLLVSCKPISATIASGSDLKALSTYSGDHPAPYVWMGAALWNRRSIAEVQKSVSRPWLPALLCLYDRVCRKNSDICGGKACVKGRRIRVQDVAYHSEWCDWSADQIAEEFGLSLSQVHGALAYYFDNLEENREEMRESERLFEKLKSEIPSKLAAKLDAPNQQHLRGCQQLATKDKK